MRPRRSAQRDAACMRGRRRRGQRGRDAAAAGRRRGSRHVGTQRLVGAHAGRERGRGGGAAGPAVERGECGVARRARPQCADVCGRQLRGARSGGAAGRRSQPVAARPQAALRAGLRTGGQRGAALAVRPPTRVGSSGGGAAGCPSGRPGGGQDEARSATGRVRRYRQPCGRWRPGRRRRRRRQWQRRRGRRARRRRRQPVLVAALPQRPQHR
mmetsp:Transcript_14034/g.40752  ORF Transcript_14034/g.40752 Transcript_14034/m.40752 type:complete len:213 (-) Transcript_14034:419-1057(-)